MNIFGISYNRLYSFYSLPKNSIDILFMGSSHAYDCFLPTILWEQLGITSYNLAQQEQPLVCSYFYMKELLKTQKPKLIILDLFAAYWPKYLPTVNIIHKNIDHLKPSTLKYNCYKKMVPYNKRKHFLTNIIPEEENITTQPIPYSKQCIDDFYVGDYYSMLLSKNFNRLLGKFLYTSFIKKNRHFNPKLLSEVPKYNKKILHEIINFTKKNNINLLLVKTPYDKSCGIEFSTKYIKDLCHNNKLKYLNFNDHLDDMNLSLEDDFLDWEHLNFKGAKKATYYLSQYILRNYKNIFENKKNNCSFDIWNKYSEYYNTKIENAIQNNIFLDKIDSSKEIFFEDLSLYQKYNINISSIYNTYSSLNCSISTSLQINDSPIFKIDYIVYPYCYTGLTRIIPKHISNWSNMQGIEAVIMTNDSLNKTAMQIRTCDNLYWKCSKKLSTTDFQLVRFPFCEFKNFENKVNNPKLDLSAIKLLEIEMYCPENTNKSCGSIFIKELRLY